MIRIGASGKDAELEINLFDGAGVAITGHAFLAGEVLISLPNANAALEVFGNADEANIIEKGRGRYALRLTALETATGGMVHLDLDTTAAGGCMPHSVTERIGVVDANIDMVKGDDCPPLANGRFDASIGYTQSTNVHLLQAGLGIRRVQILGVGADYVTFNLQGQMGGEANETIAANTLVGHLFTLECLSRTVHDGSYPQTRQIIAWEDLGSNLGKATMHRAWSPMPTGDVGAEGDYQGTVWPGGPLASEIQSGLATSTTVTTAETAILAALDTVLADLLAIGGLLHRNAMVDGGAGQTGPSYDANGNMLVGRVRVFTDAAGLAAATLGAADDADGEVYRFTLTGTVASQKMASFKALQVIP
jgi:hypothetical protein